MAKTVTEELMSITQAMMAFAEKHKIEEKKEDPDFASILNRMTGCIKAIAAIKTQL